MVVRTEGWMVTCEKPAEVELRVRSPGVDDVTCCGLGVRVRVDQRICVDDVLVFW